MIEFTIPMYTTALTTNIQAGCSSLYFKIVFTAMSSAPTTLNLKIKDLTNNLIYDTINLISLPSCGITTDSSIVSTTYTYEYLIPVGCLNISSLPITDVKYKDALYCLTLDSANLQGSFTSTINLLNTCVLCCQIKNMASDITISECQDCNTSNTFLNRFIEANALLTALEYSGSCANVSDTNENIKNLQNFLININCKSC